MTHLDFGGAGAGAAVHAIQSDGVELALVQVDHRQLIGLVRRGHWGSQGKLKLIPEPLWWGASVGAGVDWAGLLLRERVAVWKSLETHTHKGICY